jgi:hypothetical protein
MSRRIRIFVSSPGDVADERRQCGEAVEELNATMRALIPDQDVELELIRWESDTHPDLAGSPQDVVDEQLPADYDIFLGIMWSRFGTPTGESGSGTEHEFRASQRGWRDRRQPSHLLFYFCEAPFAPPASVAAVEQLKDVIAFRNEVSSAGSDRCLPGPDQIRRSRAKGSRPARQPPHPG